MDKKTALELYTLYRQENSLWLGNHREHSQQYFALVSAIVGASIVAISQFDKLDPLIMALITIGPLINLYLCRIAVDMCDRSYQAYLEGITIQQKLETVIGLTEKRILPEDPSLIRFVKDEFFLPERWLESSNFATALAFVSHKKNMGANRIIKQTFNILYIFNILLAIGIEAYSLFGTMSIV